MRHCGICFEVCPSRFNAVIKISGTPVPPPIPRKREWSVRKSKRAMSQIRMQIDGKEVHGQQKGMTVLEAARSAGISIPTLCHHEKLAPFGGCRICIVEAEISRREKLVASCVFRQRTIWSSLPDPKRSTEFARSSWSCCWLMLRTRRNCRILAGEYGADRDRMRKRLHFVFIAVYVSILCRGQDRRTLSDLSTGESEKRSVSFRKSPPRSATTARSVFLSVRHRISRRLSFSSNP